MSRLWNASCCKLIRVRRLLRDSSDLIIALVLTLTFTIIVTAFPEWESIIRAGFGAVVMLLIPGYLLTLVLFPTNDGIDVAERTALTLALSAITIIATGLVLNYLPVGIRAGSIAVGLTITNTTFVIFGSLQRARLEPQRRFLLPPALGIRRLLAGAAGFIAVVALFNFVIPQDRFTEFYLLGPSGQLDDYTRYLEPGETFDMRVGVTNLEGQPQTYRIRLPADDPSGDATFIEVPQLRHEETWETPLTLQAPRTLGSRQLVFDLLREDNLTAYRQLTFTIDVDPERREQRVRSPDSNNDVATTDTTPTDITPDTAPTATGTTDNNITNNETFSTNITDSNATDDNVIDNNATPTVLTVNAPAIFWLRTLDRPSADLLTRALEPPPSRVPPFNVLPSPTRTVNPRTVNPRTVNPRTMPVATTPTTRTLLEDNRATPTN